MPNSYLLFGALALYVHNMLQLCINQVNITSFLDIVSTGNLYKGDAGMLIII